MRLSEIHNTIPIIESMRTDFYDMYLLSSVQHSDDPDVEALLTDRVDRLIDHFRSRLYSAFISRLVSMLSGTPEDQGSDASIVHDMLSKVNDPQKMFSIIRNIAGDNVGKFVATIIGTTEEEDEEEDESWVDEELQSVVNHNWFPVVEIFFKFCNPPNSTKSKIMLLDKLFGLAHESGPLTDYLDQTGWLFDALYTRALAHPNELAKHASHDARQAAKSGDIGYGLGSSLSSYKPVADVDKLNLYRAKQERGDVSRPSQSPHWFPDDDDDDADN